MGFLLGFVYVVFTLVCLFLIMVVLLQRGDDSSGLGGAFGGGGGDTPFGARGDMTWKRTTAVVAGLFLVLAISIGILQKRQFAGAVGPLKPRTDATLNPDKTGEGNADKSAEGSDSGTSKN